MAQHDAGSRPWTFWFFAAFFVLFVIFLYGPMFVVYVLSFQGEDGGLTFPLQGVSTHWFHELVDPNARSGDIAGAFQRSIGLGDRRVAADGRAVGRGRPGFPPQLPRLGALSSTSPSPA